MSTAIQVHGQQGGAIQQANDYDGLVMSVSPAEALRRVQELQAFVSKVMVDKTDYGVIPGTDKPTLLQPGAQKLAEIYGFAWDFEDVSKVEDWQNGFFLYRKKCVITSRRDGRFICASVGSCNSKEDRYAGRWVFDNEIPAGLDKKLLKCKKFTSKKNGREYTKFRVPNEDIYSLVNTIEKMACKRSFVGAIISATRSAGVFTQDVEDLPAEAFGQAEEERSWDKPKPQERPATQVVDAEFADAPATTAIDDSEVNILVESLGAAQTQAELADAKGHAMKVRAKLNGAQYEAVKAAIEAASKRIGKAAA